MVFTRSGNMKRYNHGSSSHNMKNVPPYKSITDYIIHRNVIENEEFKVWKDHWVTMFSSIAMFKPLDFKEKHYDSVLEKYEDESYKNVTISPALQNGKSLYLNLNDDQYIYKVDINFEALKQNDLDFWTCKKIGYIKSNDQVLQIEVLDQNRVLVLTNTELQVYDIEKIEPNVDSFIKLLELQKYEQIDKSMFGSLNNSHLFKIDVFILNFIKIENQNKLLMTTGDVVSIENTQPSILKTIDFATDKSNSDKVVYLTTLIGDDLFFSFEGNTIYKKQKVVTENTPEELVLDIVSWNDTIAEYEEDKLEEITAISISKSNSAFLLTSHINGDINVWNIQNGKVIEKSQKIIKVSHSLIQNRELLVNKITKKANSDKYIESNNGRLFNKYDYNIVENFHSSKRLNQLDENGVEWIYPYINKIEWISPFEFVSSCSRSGYIYHWNILPFIKHDLQVAKKEDDTLEKWTSEEIQENLLVFKQSSGGRRRDRSPKYLEEAYIKTRMMHSVGYSEEHKKYYIVNNDGSIVLYNPLN